ncbi:hypothetical protein CDD83_8961 [Cordyceps sp. RAO-2017]|nr:hypothetical protein CDD83_8961 [Cordyceps sp. RAO-2017]
MQEHQRALPPLSFDSTSLWIPNGWFKLAAEMLIDHRMGSAKTRSPMASEELKNACEDALKAIAREATCMGRIVQKGGSIGFETTEELWMMERRSPKTSDPLSWYSGFLETVHRISQPSPSVLAGTGRLCLWFSLKNLLESGKSADDETTKIQTHSCSSQREFLEFFPADEHQPMSPNWKPRLRRLRSTPIQSFSPKTPSPMNFKDRELTKSDNDRTQGLTDLFDLLFTFFPADDETTKIQTHSYSSQIKSSEFFPVDKYQPIRPHWNPRLRRLRSTPIQSFSPKTPSPINPKDRELTKSDNNATQGLKVVLDKASAVMDLSLLQLAKVSSSLAGFVESPSKDSRPSSQVSSVLPSGIKRRYVKGMVNGAPVEAVPDTGADLCFISPHLVSGLGLSPNLSTQKEIRLPNRKVIQSPGCVMVPWRFAGERETHRLDCWILPGVHDLVLGGYFLKATQTLTKFVRRLKSKIFPLPGRFRLDLLGEESQRLLGYLDGHPTSALPDTGSDLMVISGAYARKLGLTIDRDRTNWLEVEFGDGTTDWTSGVVRDVPWQVGGKTARCDFHVLDDLCVDVILSQSYLFETKAFLENGHCFFDADSEEVLYHLCGIRLLGRYGDALETLEEEYFFDVASPDVFSTEMVQRELARRDRIRDVIAALHEKQREAAARAEEERKRRWQDLRETHRARLAGQTPASPGSAERDSARRSQKHSRRGHIPGGPGRRGEAAAPFEGVALWRASWKERVGKSIFLRS